MCWNIDRSCVLLIPRVLEWKFFCKNVWYTSGKVVTRVFKLLTFCASWSFIHVKVFLPLRGLKYVLVTNLNYCTNAIKLSCRWSRVWCFISQSRFFLFNKLLVLA